MLQLKIPPSQLYDETTNEFSYTKEQTLLLEHSLISISKWESYWQKSYMSKKEKTVPETLDYIRLMTVTKNVDPNVYKLITAEQLEVIRNYINSPMSATVFNDYGTNSGSGKNKIYTSEQIYSLMIDHKIPVNFEKWHLNRLLNLIRIRDIQASPKKRKSRSEQLRDNAALNEQRKAQYNTTG